MIWLLWGFLIIMGIFVIPVLGQINKIVAGIIMIIVGIFNIIFVLASDSMFDKCLVVAVAGTIGKLTGVISFMGEGSFDAPSEIFLVFGTLIEEQKMPPVLIAIFIGFGYGFLVFALMFWMDVTAIFWISPIISIIGGIAITIGGFMAGE